MGRLPRELALEIPVLYENRRVHIYGCPECGDLECGSVTMQLLETETSVIWQKFDDGREKIAAYITEDKSFHDTNLLDLWLTEEKNYGILHAFVASEHEYDYEFIYSYKNNKYIVERDADIRTDLTPTVDYPAVGPFEFENSQARHLPRSQPGRSQSSTHRPTWTRQNTEILPVDSSLLKTESL
jgi:hypothetical protein